MVRYLKQYLTTLCENFKAGNTSKCLSEWKKLTSDNVILSDIRGRSIECTDLSAQHRLRPPRFSQTETMIIDTEINKFLTMEVIKPEANKTEGLISNIFVRSKKDGGYRFILNLKEFNKNVAYYHFKMDSLNTLIIKLMHKGCFMASIYIKDAYYSISIREADQKYQQFQLKREVYHITCLPNGLTSGLRKFTKIFKPPLTTLHKLGHISLRYLDVFTYRKKHTDSVHRTLLTLLLGLLILVQLSTQQNRYPHPHRR